MTEGSTLALAAETTGASGQTLVWALAMQARQRDDRRENTPHAASRDRAALVHATTEARKALLEAALAANTAALRARSVANVLDEALAALAAAQTAPARRLPAANGFQHETRALSPREKDVLALVAEGRSNKAIADALFISPNTVKTHVASLLHKLHAESRAQLAAMVAGQGVRERALRATRQG